MADVEGSLWRDSAFEFYGEWGSTDNEKFRVPDHRPCGSGSLFFRSGSGEVLPGCPEPSDRSAAKAVF